MKQTPILFSQPMVEAIIEDRKGVTRRVVKPQPDDNGVSYMHNAPIGWEEHYKDVWHPWKWDTGEGESISKECPYGKVGDLLYVREAHYRWGVWVEDGKTKAGNTRWKFISTDPFVAFTDNQPEKVLKSRDKKDPSRPRWYKRNSLFMPKSAARIWLEITDIKAERVQDISEEDAVKEGVKTRAPLMAARSIIKITN